VTTVTIALSVRADSYFENLCGSTILICFIGYTIQYYPFLANTVNLGHGSKTSSTCANFELLLFLDTISNTTDSAA
jgi:hypothetical protein